MADGLQFGGLAIFLLSLWYMWDNLSKLLGLTVVKIYLGNVAIGGLGVIIGLFLMREGPSR